MKYQAFLPHFGSVGGWWWCCGEWVGGWCWGGWCCVCGGVSSICGWCVHGGMVCCDGMVCW